MRLQHLCTACTAAGVQAEPTTTDDFLVACVFCGAVDERATWTHNTKDVGVFGAIMGDEARAQQFLEERERLHDDFVDRLLDAYLVNPATRIVVEGPAEHFKAGARQWYNRMRGKEQLARGLKHATTNNEARKTKYRVVIAIQFAIEESNVLIARNRIPQLQQGEASTVRSASRGDGSIMAPSSAAIFARTNSLDPDSIAHLDSWRILYSTHRYFARTLNRGRSPTDLVMSKVIVLVYRIQTLARLPWSTRKRALFVNDLAPGAKSRGVTADTAEQADFVLNAAAWDYMKGIDWTRAVETAYSFYCAQQVVDLWQHRATVEIACALLLWAIETQTQTSIPNMWAWMRELTHPYSGSEKSASQRRNELKELLVCWSTSFPDAGFAMPILPKPKRGNVGNGLKGYGSDNRRPIPENVMAIAAAPIVAAHWPRIMRTRLAKRDKALPLDTEFTMAAKMFASAFAEHQKARRKAAKDRKRAEQQETPEEAKLKALQAAFSTRRKTYATTRAESRATSVAKSKATSVASSRAASVARSRASSAASSRASSVVSSRASTPSGSQPTERNRQQARRSRVAPAPSPAPTTRCNPRPVSRPLSREDMMRRMLGQSTAPPQPPSPSVEELLAVDDSSDEDVGRDSDEEDAHDGPGSTPTAATLRRHQAALSREREAETALGLRGVKSSSAFAFSIGPDGFSVATEGAPGPLVAASADVADKGKRRAAPGSADNGGKRRRLAPPMSPPPTSPSSFATSASQVVDAPSPASTSRTLRAVSTLSTASDAPSSSASQPSPSSRGMSLAPSPAPTNITLDLASLPSDMSSHVGLLIREREQYAQYRPDVDRATGRSVSVAVEKRMNAWIRAARASGSLPPITRTYLAGLGIHGDPRQVDLGPYIRAHPEWSTTEALLRAGLQPLEFPSHLVPHSLLEVDQQLGGYRLEDRLAHGPLVGDALDAELAVLFPDEDVAELFCSPDEVRRREQQYLEQGVWAHPADVPEGMLHRLDGEHGERNARKERQRAMAGASVDGISADLDRDEAEIADPDDERRRYARGRINYDALQRLCFGESDDEDAGDGDDDGDGGGDDEEDDAIRDVLGETLWNAVGVQGRTGWETEAEDGDEGEGNED